MSNLVLKLRGIRLLINDIYHCKIILYNKVKIKLNIEKFKFKDISVKI
jgi:hypothetical protein